MNLEKSSNANSWLKLAEENRGTDRFEISYAAFRSLVDGVAPGVDELAAAVDLRVDDAPGLIQRLVSEGRLRLDADGSRVIGAAGLSLGPSRHGLMMSRRQFGVWCALDAVGIPAGLGVDALVESQCSSTGQPVSIQIEQGWVVSQSPEDLMISLVPASVATSVYDTLCSRILFYSHLPDSPDPEAEYLPVEMVADLGRRLWRNGIPL